MQKRKFHIAINTRLLLKDKLEGIGWFEYHILKNWVENHPEHNFYFIFDRTYDPSFIFGSNVVPIVLSPPARHALLWYLWYEWRIPKLLKKIKADIFISLDSYTSIRSKVKKLTAIHDIAFALFNGQMDMVSQKFMRHFTPRYISSSDKIITVSNATKRDLISHYQCPEDKIYVTNNAPSSSYKPLTTSQISNFKNEHTEGHDFFLYVGSIHPRKNVLHLLKAFEQYKEKGAKTKLVLIGRMAWKYSAEKEYLAKMNYRSDIILVPHSTPETIALWMASCLALTLISHYEGFGVPIVEAMACQVPVICSNISSMPEIAGEAAIIVNPNNIEEISNAFHTISSDHLLRAKLIENGQLQVKKFTWKNASFIVWKEVEDLITN